MSRIGQIRIIIAIVLTVLVTIFTISYIDKQTYVVEVVVASTDLELGHKITEEDVTHISISKDTQLQLFPNATSDQEDVLGTVLRKNLEKNQPFTVDDDNLVMGDALGYALLETGEVNPLYFVPEDSRLVTIETDASGSVFYSVKKGDYVDVIYSSVDESTGGLYSTMILQHVMIFAVEKIVVEAEGVISKKQNVTLVTTPENSIKLVAANRNGVIDLILNPLFGTTADIEPVHIQSFHVQPPATKEEQLLILKEHIENIDLTEYTKKSLLKSITTEKDISTLKSLVDVTNIDEATKAKIKSLLE